MHLRKPSLRLTVVAAMAAVAVAAGCSSSPPVTSTGKPIQGGTVTMGFLAGTQPNYIFPFRGLTYYSVYNAQYFDYLMYRPLYVFGDNGQSVTASFGVACTPDTTAQPAELVAVADAALYQAKRLGRNRVEVAARRTPRSSRVSLVTPT